MVRCPKCKVVLSHDRAVCPLCRCVTEEMNTEDQEKITELFGEGAPYPDLMKKHRALRFVVKLLFFLFVLAQIIMVIINVKFTPHVAWSAITGAALIYGFGSLIYWIKTDAGFAAKVGQQLILTSVLLYVIDYYSGNLGWALGYAIPGVILFGDATVSILIALHRKSWYSYLLLLLMIGLMSLAELGLYFAGFVGNIIMPLICVIVTGMYILGALLFGSSSALRELKRRFHI